MFRTLAASQHLNIVDSARLFASENLAAADAAIGCWNNKYHWNTWRPITAIREAAQRRKPGHHAPTRHGHRCSIPSTPVATPPAARHPAVPRVPLRPQLRGRLDRRDAAGLLRHRQRSPSARSSNKSGTTRTFHRFSDALKENINARVWAGIHFRTADIQGAKLGEKVARYLHNHYLQPVRHYRQPVD